MFTGATALVGQVLLIRHLLVLFHGNELTLGVLFASWFLGIIAGATSARRWPGERSEFFYKCGIVGLPTLLTGVLVLTYMARAFTRASAGEVPDLWSNIAMVVALTAPVGFLVGALFVLATDVYGTRIRQKTLSGGAVYVLETLGSVFGLLLFTFFLVRRFSGIDVALGCLWLSLVLLVALTRGSLVWKTLAWIMLAIIMVWTVGSSIPHRFQERLADGRWQTLHPGLERRVSEDSPYQHIGLGERGEEYSLFGNGIYFYSFPNPSLFDGEANLAYTVADAPRKVLLIGNGPGALLHSFLKLPVERITVLEMDPTLVDVVSRYLEPGKRSDLERPECRLVIGDPRAFIRSTTDRYDLIRLDYPSPDSILLGRVFTREFYRDVSSALNPKGVFVTPINVGGTYLGSETGDLFRSVFFTLQSVFPEVRFASEPSVCFFSAKAKGVLMDDPRALAHRYRGLGLSSPFFFPESFMMYFSSSRTRVLRMVLYKGPADLNTDNRPELVLNQMMIRQKQAGHQRSVEFLHALKALPKLRPYFFIALILAVGILVFKGGRNTAACSTIFSTGLCAMSLEMMLLFVFQTRKGALYEEVGLVTALFMLGLGMGAVTALNWSRPSGSTKRSILWLDMGLAGLVSLALLPLDVLGGRLLWPLVIATGALAGAQFPLVFSYRLGTDSKARAVASAASDLEAWDHGGALVGALVTGSILVPLVGLSGCAVVLIAVKLSNIAVLLLNKN